ncbi:hypothetical protein T492DRAFT_355943 [Pavlovales sp. CCMP2436]|nr:hypothetical protein T492DRAFT_355943 [Pavlovales sp. CCMP2436]
MSPSPAQGVSPLGAIQNGGARRGFHDPSFEAARGDVMRKPQAAARQQLLLQRAADVLAQPSQAHGKRPVKGLHPTRGVRLATARLLECSCFALVLAACVLLTLNACCRVSDQPQWRGQYPCALRRSHDLRVLATLGPRGDSSRDGRISRYLHSPRQLPGARPVEATATAGMGTGKLASLATAEAAMAAVNLGTLAMTAEWEVSHVLHTPVSQLAHTCPVRWQPPPPSQPSTTQPPTHNTQHTHATYLMVCVVSAIPQCQARARARHPSSSSPAHHPYPSPPLPTQPLTHNTQHTHTHNTRTHTNTQHGLWLGSRGSES